MESVNYEYFDSENDYSKNPSLSEYFYVVLTFNLHFSIVNKNSLNRFKNSYTSSTYFELSISQEFHYYHHK